MTKYLEIIFKARGEDVEMEHLDVTKEGMVIITIDLETKILTSNQKDDIFCEVVDTGTYVLLDEERQVIKIIDYYYIPDCIPNEYNNDYIDLELQDGKITNWVSTQDQIIEEFNKKGIDIY